MLAHAARPGWSAGLRFVLLAGGAAAAAAVCASPGTRLQGRIDSGHYVSPGQMFRVAVPEMRNPFIKEPGEISDRTGPEGEEVDFSVLELGEAHRFGARRFDASTDLDAFFHAEITRWTRHWVNTTGAMELLLEETIHLADGAGTARIYHVDAASLLFGSKGGAKAQRHSALVGIIVVPVPDADRILFAVSQFDMPNRGGHHTLDTERGRNSLARQHLKRVVALSETLGLPR
jgi:hypothetical protein